MDYQNFEYQLEESRNGNLIPIVNGTYLHSIYDPEKESSQWVENYESQLAKKNTVLVLGLGFGYHIDAIIETIQRFHESFEIIVLEPNKENINQFVASRNFSTPNVKIVFIESVEDVYSDKKFVEFLATKPAVIKHDSSYTLYSEIFSHFLSFKSSESYDVYQRTITDLTRSLFNLNDDHHSDKVQGMKNSKRMDNRSDFLLMSFLQLSNSGK